MDKIISRILDIEKQARQIVEEAKSGDAKIETEVSAHLSAHRTECQTRGQTHIDAIRKTEWDGTEAELQKLKSDYAEKNKRLETWESVNFSKWLNGLMEKIKY